MTRLGDKSILEAAGRNTVHPFPARMAPGIAFEILRRAKKPIRVLDPMMGSGTVLAVARSRGHKAIGIDIDPLAVLITRVWTSSIDVDEVRDKAHDVLRRAKSRFESLRARDAYPQHSDEETRQFIRYWFDDYARRQLAALAIAIAHVHDRIIRDVLWCSFSRLIITKQAGASLAMDLSHSRPHKKFDRAPVKPFRRFATVVDRVLTNCIGKRLPNRGPAPIAYLGDARYLPLADASIDLVLTSPPYLNAIDYMRCSKFSLVWMGYGVRELRCLRAEAVGSDVGRAISGRNQQAVQILRDLRLRPALATREESVLVRYIHDMRSAVAEVARVLSPGGRAVYVVGDNMIKGTFIPNSLIVSTVAELAGLKLEDRHIRTLPTNRRYLPPPLARFRPAKLDVRMSREVILSFRSATRNLGQSPP
jgi:SAM-dependent methyltransferase